eukprot:TRINITY_DN241_c0_g1_i2.p1 TRINITY_DN241_c0_g1~~TRINITY_DN241_c0_g1_i2.p1  ORF type:complete len:463 (-),score=82.51 TRINITY_DN241_c0_g1_i2:90-1412(-)
MLHNNNNDRIPGAKNTRKRSKSIGEVIADAELMLKAQRFVEATKDRSINPDQPAPPLPPTHHKVRRVPGAKNIQVIPHSTDIGSHTADLVTNVVKERSHTAVEYEKKDTPPQEKSSNDILLAINHLIERGSSGTNAPASTTESTTKPETTTQQSTGGKDEAPTIQSTVGKDETHTIQSTGGKDEAPTPQSTGSKIEAPTKPPELSDHQDKIVNSGDKVSEKQSHAIENVKKDENTSSLEKFDRNIFMKTLTAATKKLAKTLVLEQQVALDIEDMSSLTPEQQKVLEVQVKEKIGTLRAKNVVRPDVNAIFNPEFFQKPPATTTETQNNAEQTPQRNENVNLTKTDETGSHDDSSSVDESDESESEGSDSEDLIPATSNIIHEDNEKCSIPNEVEDLMNQVVSGNVMGLNDFLSNMCTMQRPVRQASSKNLLHRLSQDSNV